MIYIRDIKYGGLLNSSYSVEDGSFNLDFDMSRYSVGDRVSFMLPAPDWQVWAIKENCTDKNVEVATGKIIPDSQLYVYVDFRVVDKRHTLCLGRERFGSLEPMSVNLYLQAVSWGHEDLFKWLCMGILPSWIREDEIDGYKSSYPFVGEG